MHPEVADEANPDTKASTTVRAEVGRCCAVSAGGSGFACSTFLLSSEDSVLMLNSFRETFGLSLKSFYLPSDCGLALKKFSTSSCFGLLSSGMTSPSQLSLANDANDARNVCLLQDLHVGDFILPADVEKITEAYEMELV